MNPTGKNSVDKNYFNGYVVPIILCDLTLQFFVLDQFNFDEKLFN